MPIIFGTFIMRSPAKIKLDLDESHNEHGRARCQLFVFGKLDGNQERQPDHAAEIKFLLKAFQTSGYRTPRELVRLKIRVLEVRLS